jgi:hypothetical protein
VATELRLRILDVESDDEALERGSIQLRRELGELDVDAVTGLQSDAPPEGTRAGPVAALGALAVSVVQTVRGWLARSGGKRTVRLEIGGDVLELTGTTSAVQERLVDEWIRSHATTEGSR